MEGNVSTKNNGGFIQVRSSKEIVSDNFKGIKLKVSGKPSEYYIHIRTNFLLCHGNTMLENFLLIKSGNTSRFILKILKSLTFTSPQHFQLQILKVSVLLLMVKTLKLNLISWKLNYFSMSEKKNNFPKTKVKNPEPKIGDPDWIIWAAWADRITFEEIFEKTGKRESEVIKIMRRSLKPSSFRLWRKRVHTKSIKNRKLFSKSREKLNKQKIINSDY